MANLFPCPKKIDCLCEPGVRLNFSSEAFDPADFYGVTYFNQQPPLGAPEDFWTIPQSTGVQGQCESQISQTDAGECALRDAQNDVWNNWKTNGHPIARYGNHQTSCQPDCPDGETASTVTIPAGTFEGLSQEEADAIAEDICNQRAAEEGTCTPVSLDPVAWWTMEGAGPNLVDVINGITLHRFISLGNIFYQAPGKIDFGVQMSFAVAAGQIDVFLDTNFVAFPYAGVGIDVTLWFKVTTGTNATFDIFNYTFPTGELFFLRYNTNLGTLVLTLGTDIVSIPYNAIDGIFHFYRAFFDPVTARFGFQIDNGTVHSAATAFNVAAGANGELGLFMATDHFANPSNINVFWDELAIWPRPLDVGELDTLWNGGAGTTWPL